MSIDIHQGTTQVSTLSARHQFRNWWSMNGSPRVVCAIYNDGKSLFVDNTAYPGEFLKTPLYPYHWDEPTIDVGDIWVAHKGTFRCRWGGNAFVKIFNSHVEVEVTIPPLHLTYAICVQNNFLKHMTRFFPLPRRLLPLVR